MPVQIRNQVAVERPGGQVVPPAAIGGDVELRLHGVGGTSPENLLGDLAPQLVAGDRIAGFYRTADQLTGGVGKRHVEAYSWGGLTSRSASRVLWVLMLPFALANVAGWMCMPDVLAHKSRFYLHRFAVRFAGMALTVNVALLLTMAGSDLIGYQCVQSDSCMKALPVAPLLTRGLFAHHRARAVVAGTLLPMVVLLGFYLLARRSAGRYERVQAPGSSESGLGDTSGAVDAKEYRGSAARVGTGLSDGNFWHGFESARRLSVLHLAAGFALVAFILARTTHHTLAAQHGDGWYVAAAAAASVALAASFLSLAKDTCPVWWTRAVLIASIATLMCAAADAWMIGASTNPLAVLTGMRWTANVVYGLVGFAILLTVTVVVYGRGREPGSFLWPGPAIVLAFAFGLVNAVSALVIIRIGSWLNAPRAKDPSAADTRDSHLYGFIGSVAAWTLLAAIATAVLYAIWVGVVWWFKGRAATYRHIQAMYESESVPADDDAWRRVAGSEDGCKEDRKWLGGIARVRYLAGLPRHVDLLIVLIVAGAAAALVGVGLCMWLWHLPIVPASPIWTVTTWTAAALPVLLVAFMRWGWRSGAARRHIGIAWDVATFWPRAYHPFAPPCYAERAVPDLQWRLWHLQDGGADITLVAHSQGSIIAAAALLQHDARKPGSAVGLLTFGSPMDTLYRWAFPAYFGQGTLKSITASSGDSGQATVRRWHNLYYLTDYIGRTSIDGAENKTLPDPPSRYYIRGQKRPSIGTHSGYWTDPAVWSRIDELGDNRPSQPPFAEPSTALSIPQQSTPVGEPTPERDSPP
jgi:hypothetical protein